MSTLIANRYELHEELGQGGMGAVYRATDHLNDSVVALKRLLVLPADLRFRSADADEDNDVLLAREFQTIASLRHPHIISVLDYGFDAERRPFFTMPLLEGAQTLKEAAKEVNLDARVELLIQVLQALAYLHRRGILHRDLKPANVLVCDGQARVLDFGLAVNHEHDIQTAGTLAYMAPEVIEGYPATRNADLYAVGVMAYEILAGRHPYDLSNHGELLHDILESKPDMPNLMVPDGPTVPLKQRVQPPEPSPEVPLGNIVLRLMRRDPVARYSDAHEVINDFCTAINRSPTSDDEAIRESFLQAATFVGRGIEIATLQGALDRAIDGEGSVWLVGGESGVGKSRLVEELRVRALVSGVSVLMGQGAVDGGLPYQLWREPLRHLALSTPLTEMEAAILRDLVPDIETLVGFPVAPAVEVAGEEYQRRLSATIGAILHRQPVPLLLILEDLQWANEGLEILKPLCEAVADWSVLVVGTFRNDERPDIPAQVPTEHLLELERLAPDHVAELSQAMLGEDGDNPRLVALLQEETEGNVFFLVEMVRTLAEEAGSLSAIGDMELPTEIIAGGVDQIVRRRLSRVPAEWRPMLKLAALGGRQLNLEVLRHTATGQRTDLDRWLFQCAEIAVLAPQEAGWRFSHDRLRETLVDDLSAAERPALHRQMAEAIETVYPDATEYAAILADHWGAAGMHDRERRYATLAGKQSFQRSAFREAAAYYRRAASLLPATGGLSERAIIQMGLADTSFHLSEYLQATYLYQECLRWARGTGDRLVTARALTGLGRVHHLRGEYPEAIRLLQESLEISRDMNDRQGQGRTTYVLASVHHFRGELEPAANLFREAAALCRAAGDQQGELDSLSGLGLLFEELGQIEEAIQFENRALELARIIGSRLGEGRALGNLGSIHFGQRRMSEAIACYEQALSISRAIGHRRNTSVYLTNLGNVYVTLGRIETAIAAYQEAHSIAQAIGDRRSAALNLMNLAITKAKTGYIDEAMHFFTQTLVVARAADDAELELHVLTNLSYGFITLNDLDQSLAYNDQGLRVARQLGDRREASQLLTDRATVMLAQGQVTAAIKTGRAALDEAVQSQDLHRQCRASVALCWALLTAGEVGEARRIIEAAAALDVPDDDDYLEAALGVVCLYDGDVEAARTAFETAVQQAEAVIVESPDNYETWYALGLARAGLAAIGADSLERAANAYQEALVIAPYAGIIALAQRDLKILARCRVGDVASLQAILEAH